MVTADRVFEAGTGATLRAEAVAVQTGGRTILAPIDLAFRPGEVVGIVGHNGSGKSTLLKCLARQIVPSGGRVTLNSRATSEWGARAFAREVAYLPQQTPASTGLLGRELVAFGRYPWHGPLGRIGDKGNAAIADAMRLADVDPFADRLVDHLSGGERQRVWIAMLIAQETRFILLDEPIAALDLAHQLQVLGVLRQLARERNAGVGLVLHDINMAARFCDTVVALRSGSLIAQGTPSDILQAAVLEDVFGVPMHVLSGPDMPVAVPA